MAIQKREEGAIASTTAQLEKVLVTGDLSVLSESERIAYYAKVCESVGLNPLTKPFEYIKLNGKLTLYAVKGCTDQLRKINGISLSKPDIQFEDGLVVVTLTASDRHGRTDSDVGAVVIDGLRGEAKANAIMKAITKGKRRVTLSICGLGLLDESEVYSDDFGGDRTPPSDYKQSEDWLKFLGAVEKAIAAGNLDALKAIETRAYQNLSAGAFPKIARNGIEYEIKRAAEIISDRHSIPVAATAQVVESDSQDEPENLPVF